MSWLDIFRKAVPKAAYLETGKGPNIRRSKKQNYICECVIYFDGNPLRRVNFEIPAYTRSHAEDEMNKKLRIEVARTFKRKDK